MTADAVQGLEDYSHVWNVFVFHLNTVSKKKKNSNNQSNSVPSKIAPPALGGTKVGVLASRSPHRFNPIGMTLAKLERIETKRIYNQNDLEDYTDAGVNSENNNPRDNRKKKKTKASQLVTSLYLSGLDLVDGTPVLDIKPYVATYDAPPAVSGAVTAAAPITTLDGRDHGEDANTSDGVDTLQSKKKRRRKIILLTKATRKTILTKMVARTRALIVDFRKGLEQG